MFGSIDIRNSSVERAHSIQLDLIEQLQMAREIIRKAHKEMQFPLFQEIEFKIDKYISSVSEMLIIRRGNTDPRVLVRSGDIHFQSHKIDSTGLCQKPLMKYYASLDPQSGMIYQHRKEYEESITEDQ